MSVFIVGLHSSVTQRFSFLKNENTLHKFILVSSFPASFRVKPLFDQRLFFPCHPAQVIVGNDPDIAILVFVI